MMRNLVMLGNAGSVRARITFSRKSIIGGTDGLVRYLNRHRTIHFFLAQYQVGAVPKSHCQVSTQHEAQASPSKAPQDIPSSALLDEAAEQSRAAKCSRPWQGTEQASKGVAWHCGGCVRARVQREQEGREAGREEETVWGRRRGAEGNLRGSETNEERGGHLCARESRGIIGARL